MKVTRVKTLTLASLLAIALPSAGVMICASPAFAASALKTLDPDKDGTVDLNEAKTAASALFDKLEKDNDGALDRKELHGRIPEADWAVADPDNDKTISKDEYLAYVEAVFKKADTDNDGTLDAKELKTPAGRALVRLLMK
jgi:Ca2+-binding EF-hand superfamily protein